MLDAALSRSVKTPRMNLSELLRTGRIYAMSAGEKFKFYWPIFLFIAGTIIPGVLVLKTDIAVVQNDIAMMKEDLSQYERHDVAVLEHQKIRLELQILDQKLQQLRAEFRTFTQSFKPK